MLGPILYGRSVPEAWPGLVENASTAAETLLLRGDDQRPPGLWNLGEQTVGLTKDQLRLNYFYGMGVGICELARELKDPNTVADVVQNSVAHFEAHGKMNKQGAGLLDAGFFDAIERAGKRIAPGPKLATEILHLESERRPKIVQSYMSGAGVDLTAARYSKSAPGPLTKQAAENFLGPNDELRIIKQMKVAVTAASGSLINSLLAAKTGKKLTESAPAPEDIDWLGTESVVRFVKRAVGLRLRDFDDIETSPPFMLEGDEVRFVQPQTRIEVEMPEKDYFAHSDETAVCPAANINGLVPQVCAISLDIVRLAASRAKDAASST